MHFDPYESPEAKHRRHVSNICLAIIIILFCLGVLGIIFRDTTAEPYYFDRFTVAADNVTDGNSQFFAISSRFKSEEIGFIERDDKFAEEYPTINALMLMNKEFYDENKPYAECCGDQLAIVQVYPSQYNSVRSMDVALLTLITEDDGDRFNGTITSIKKFTLQYDVSSGKITYLDHNRSVYRLQINSLSFNVAGAPIEQVDYSMTFSKVMTPETLKKEQLDKLIIDATNNSFHSPVYSKTSTGCTLATTISGDQFDSSATVKYYMNVPYDSVKMSQFTVDYGGETPPQLTIIVN